MIACSCLAVWPVLRTRSQEGLVLALFTWPMMIYVSVSGNVHAALVAALVYGLRTRWGPIAIAFAASLRGCRWRWRWSIWDGAITGDSPSPLA